MHATLHSGCSLRHIQNGREGFLPSNSVNRTCTSRLHLIRCRSTDVQDLAHQNGRRRTCAAAVLVSALLVLQPAPPCAAAGVNTGEGSPGSVPEDLRSTDKRGPSLGQLLRGPKTEEITRCTRKCMPACIRGGEGAPGLGPLTVRKDLVKFKEGFRTRAYCLSECTQVCAASITGIPAAPVDRE